MFRKKVLVLISFIFLTFILPVFAQDKNDTMEVTYAQTAASYTNYRDCIRLYKLPYGKLYALALSSINSNKYEILEMQFRNGYVIFEAEGREFLLSVMKKDKSFTFLKLTPCDNNYYFSPAIPQKIFRYIDLNFNADLKELKY